ncbi:p360-5L [African swine fever virus]|uniref:p360-5L n=1 Tax=African swine fever virus TaxID=10497 RepID=A0A6G7KU06_ASF|nr:p360-5L [African swine fever virus]
MPQIVSQRRKCMQRFRIFVRCNYFTHFTTFYYFFMQYCMGAYKSFPTKKFHYIILFLSTKSFLYFFCIRIATQTYTKMYITPNTIFCKESYFPIYFMFIATYQRLYGSIVICAYSKTILYTYFILWVHTSKRHHVIWIYTYIFLQICMLDFINITYVYSRFYTPIFYVRKFLTTKTNTFYTIILYGDLIPKFYYICIFYHFFFFIYIYDTTIVYTVYQHVQIMAIKPVENRNIIILYIYTYYDLLLFIQINKQIIQPYIYKFWISSYLDTYNFRPFRLGTYVAIFIVGTPYNKYLVYISLVFLHSPHQGSVKLIPVNVRTCHTATGYHFTLFTKTYGAIMPPYSKLLYNTNIIFMLFCKSLVFYQDFFCTNLYRIH